MSTDSLLGVISTALMFILGWITGNTIHDFRRNKRQLRMEKMIRENLAARDDMELQDMHWTDENVIRVDLDYKPKEDQ